MSNNFLDKIVNPFKPAPWNTNAYMQNALIILEMSKSILGMSKRINIPTEFKEKYTPLAVALAHLILSDIPYNQLVAEGKRVVAGNENQLTDPVKAAIQTICNPANYEICEKLDPRYFKLFQKIAKDFGVDPKVTTPDDNMQPSKLQDEIAVFESRIERTVGNPTKVQVKGSAHNLVNQDVFDLNPPLLSSAMSTHIGVNPTNAATTARRVPTTHKSPQQGRQK